MFSCAFSLTISHCWSLVRLAFSLTVGVISLTFSLSFSLTFSLSFSLTFSHYWHSLSHVGSLSCCSFLGSLAFSLAKNLSCVLYGLLPFSLQRGSIVSLDWLSLGWLSLFFVLVFMFHLLILIFHLPRIGRNWFSMPSIPTTFFVSRVSTL